MQSLQHKLKLSLISLALVSALSGCSLEGDDGVNGATGPQGAAGVDGQNGTNGNDGQSLPRDLAIEVVGRFAAGGAEIYGRSAAEIVQFHKTSNSAFAVNGALNQVEVISLANLPTAQVGSPTSDTSLSSVAFTFPDSVTVKDADGLDQMLNLGAANSIAINGDMLAIAVQNETKTNMGAVLFYTLDAMGQGTFVKAVMAGALPDMVTFTPDGSKALVANEGEPDTDYILDPEGSISVINITDNVPADNAMTINLSSDMVFSYDILDDEDFDTDAERKALLQQSVVKFASPDGTTVAQELEPEYITVSSNGEKAFVVMQESNAMGIIDLDDMTIEVRGLGFKDWSQFELDFTNKDEIPSFSSVDNLYGMYQPDTIASYEWNGATFILSANEGDSREWDAYSEEVRVKDIIDPDELNMLLSPELQAFYDASGAGLGRLKVTTALGDADGDGTYEELYAYGGRSFSI